MQFPADLKKRWPSLALRAPDLFQMTLPTACVKLFSRAVRAVLAKLSELQPLSPATSAAKLRVFAKQVDTLAPDAASKLGV